MLTALGPGEEGEGQIDWGMGSVSSDFSLFPTPVSPLVFLLSVNVFSHSTIYAVVSAGTLELLYTYFPPFSMPE